MGATAVVGCAGMGQWVGRRVQLRSRNGVARDPGDPHPEAEAR
jgi:hypothetical protein